MSHTHVAGEHDKKHEKADQPQPGQVEQTDRLIEVIDRQAADFESRLDAGAMLSASEIATARTALDQERTELQEHLLQLPPRSATATSAFHATDRISRLLERFDALDRATRAKTAVTSASAHESPEDTIADADKSMPRGYCDTAPQGVTPCQLDATRRNLYRRRIESDLQSATTNWVSAIDSKALSQRFKKEGVTFEKKLGEVLFGSLFGIIGIATKAAAHKVVDKSADVMAHRSELPNVPGTVIEPVPGSTVSEAKRVGDKMASAGTSFAEKYVATEAATNQVRTTTDIATTAEQSIDVASSEDRFIESLRDAPGQWKDSISTQVDQLFDVDLAALALGLERSKPELTVEALKRRIDNALMDFANQVSILDRRTDVIVIGVGMRDGTVRHALVESERVESPQFRKDEYPSATVTTGNWTFLRWIDRNLDAVALDHARERDWSAGASIEAFDDGRFVEGRSLQLLTGRKP